jgi:hypothetical protein
VKKVKNSKLKKCLSSQLKTQSAQNAASQSMLLKNVLPVDTNSTKDASNAECVESSWTQQTAPNTKLNCTARIATAENTDQKDTDSVAVPAVCQWTKETNSKIQKPLKHTIHNKISILFTLIEHKKQESTQELKKKSFDNF